jgi:hypothetical protein
MSGGLDCNDSPARDAFAVWPWCPALPNGYPATLKNYAEVNAEAGGYFEKETLIKLSPISLDSLSIKPIMKYAFAG